MRKMTADVAVVGGGAAGMLAAITAAERGLRVVLFERNQYVGRKLGITGKGRCNITNCCDVRTFMENVPTNGRFLYSAVNGFSPEDAMAFFEGLGIRLKVERGNRVFPVSDKAAEVVGLLREKLRKCGVPIVHERVVDIELEGGAVSAVVTEQTRCACAAAVVCTGGLSYSKTGSTGDGYRFAEKAGHRIIEPKPSLVPLECAETFCGEMQGLSLKNVRLSVYNGKGKCIFSELGEMLFTHYGVSGPLVLSASAHMRDFQKDHYTISLDLKPGLDRKKLDQRILRDFEKYANRDFGNALGDLANRLMIPVLIRRSGIPPETKVHSVTKEQRANLLELLKDFRLEVSGPRPVEEAIITSGGVDVREIDPKTMESKRVKGLYFAGEIIDVDAYTGGFNLQIAWSTGRAAGMHVEEER